LPLTRGLLRTHHAIMGGWNITIIACNGFFEMIDFSGGAFSRLKLYVMGETSGLQTFSKR